MRGFTLIELVAVLLLLALISAVGYQKLFSSREVAERGYYDELVSATRYAQKLAVASGCDVQVTVAAGGYSLASHCAGAVQHPSRGGAFERSAPSGVALSAANITFDPLGAAGADVAVTVGSRSFTVIGATGYVVTQ